MMSADTQSWTVTEIHLFHLTPSHVTSLHCTPPALFSLETHAPNLLLPWHGSGLYMSRTASAAPVSLTVSNVLRGRGRCPTRVCARNCFVWTDESPSRHSLQSNSDSGSQISSLPLINIKIILHTHCPWPHFFRCFFFSSFLFNPLNKTKRKAKYQKTSYRSDKLQHYIISRVESGGGGSYKHCASFIPVCRVLGVPFLCFSLNCYI